MPNIHFKPPLKIKSALVATLFVAAQLSFGFSGGRVFAAEVADQANTQATESIEAHQPENPGQQNENNTEEQAPTNTIAPETVQQNSDSEQGSENQSPENNPNASQPPTLVEQLTTLSQNENNDNGRVVTPTNENEDQDVMVTLCHATGSSTNPFVRITVSVSGAFNGHLGSDHQNGEDIIPPFTFNGQTHSQNWNTNGQATFSNNCIAPTGGGGGQEENVTLCHATGSATNPFVRITVSAAGAFNGHLGASHQNGEDIIPPFTFNGQTYSQNWNAAGQATFNNGCVAPSGGQGGNENGQVLGASTTNAGGSGGQVLGAQLVNTGSNILMSLIVSLTMIGLTAGAHLLSRKQYA